MCAQEAQGRVKGSQQLLSSFLAVTAQLGNLRGGGELW